MKNRCGIKSLTVFIILIVCNCVTSVNPDFCDYQSSVVVNSILVPDSFIKVHISSSLRSDLSERIISIDDALVLISGDSSKYITTHFGNGIYGDSICPTAGKGYKLEIVMKNGNRLFGYTKIPEIPNIILTPFPDENQVKVTIVDNSNEDNFYWVGQKSFTYSGWMMYYETYVSSDFNLFDDFNRTRSADITGRMNNSYHFYARLPDTKFKGKEVSFKIPHYFSDSEDYNNLPFRVYLYIINADEHLDQYMKSALIQYDLGVIGDMPVFHTPVDMYSNIENGKGIFGSYTISQFDITTPESIYQNNETGNTK
ncbi:MAG: DUF4249 family protein [Bacteroidales bacterium]|nr:DUF4249 family protein [Bacteroidales bacterium]